MNTKKVTGILLLACAIGLIIWDMFVASNAIPGDTISELVLEFARKRPAFPFALGFVCGHLLWPQKQGD